MVPNLSNIFKIELDCYRIKSKTEIDREGGEREKRDEERMEGEPGKPPYHLPPKTQNNELLLG